MRLFDLLDQNRDGYISRAEFERLLPWEQRQLYLVLKIQCLVNALNASDAARDAQIQSCTSRTEAQFDLSAAAVPGCSSLTDPAWQSNEYAPCQQMQDVSNYTFLSGTRKFVEEYYRDVVPPLYPSPCASECCNQPPPPHTAPAR